MLIFIIMFSKIEWISELYIHRILYSQDINAKPNEWIEKIEMYDRSFNVKIHTGNYELVMYVIDSDLNETLGTYELFKFIIRQVGEKYLIRLELIFDIYDMDQELEVINQIKTISKLESAILHSLR